LVNILCQVKEAELVATAAKVKVKKLNDKFTAQVVELSTMKRQHKDLEHTFKQTKAKVDGKG
jgi:hypothetical protein